MTFKNLLMCFSSMIPLFLLLVCKYFKTWNYVADSNANVACAMKRFLSFVSLNKRILNLHSHRYNVANEMNTAGAVSQSVENVTMAEHQYFSKV